MSAVDVLDCSWKIYILLVLTLINSNFQPYILLSVESDENIIIIIIIIIIKP